MSATGRGKKKRDPNDFYPTPGWTVRRFLEKAGGRLKSGTWIEPCAGDGAIIRAARPLVPHVRWHAVELQGRFEKKLQQTPGVARVDISSFLDWQYEPQKTNPSARAAVILTNPPYKMAQDMIIHAMTQAEQVCMLLRLNFLASDVRCTWMQNNTPDIYVIPNRPSFRGKGSDACEYGWFIWDDKSIGKVTILNSTPRKIRSDEKKAVQKMLGNEET